MILAYVNLRKPTDTVMHLMECVQETFVVNMKNGLLKRNKSHVMYILSYFLCKGYELRIMCILRFFHLIDALIRGRLRPSKCYLL